MKQDTFSERGTYRSDRDPDGWYSAKIDNDDDDLSAVEHGIRAAQRRLAIGEMTSGIAHDFRNILMVIASGLKLVEKNSEQPEKAREFIVGAREGVEKGLQLTSQLLTFAKRQVLVTHSANINESLKDLQLFLQYAVGTRIRIVYDLVDIPRCCIDTSQFDAAILNLVVNARDAMPNGGEIKISSERWTVDTEATGSPKRGLYVLIRVADNGKGMSSEVLGKAFDPFFTTKGEAGTGLGLPQLYAFMRTVGGHVGITSQVGNGTTFNLLFPVVG